MKVARFSLVFAVLLIPFAIGCGGQSGPAAPAADQDELSAYLDEHGDQSEEEPDDDPDGQ